MHRRTTPHRPLRITLALWLAVAATATAQFSAQLTSRYLARGEMAYLEVVLPNSVPDALPTLPTVPEVSIRATAPGAVPRQAQGRRVEYVFQYAVQSYTTGRHTIPPIEVSFNGQISRTEPIEFVVFNADELPWQETTLAGRSMRYAAGFQTLNPQPYNGQTIPLEIKLYLPREVAMTIEDWGIPEFERDGVACWRMQPSTMKGRVNILGREYIAVGYPTTLTPTRQGNVSVGPAKLRLSSTQLIVDGFLQRITEETTLQIPKLALDATPLPPGAPQGFANAIGAFTLQATTSDTEVVEGDPISIDLTVTGSGNLDSLKPPRLQNATDWKVYESTAAPRGEERRELSGSVVFQQLIKPLKKTTAIPAFELAYFDPVLKAYRTVTTPPIPLKVLPSGKLASAPAPAGPPPSLATPVERMTDILAIIPNPDPEARPRSPLPPWLGHALAALAAATLLGRIAAIRVLPKLRKSPTQTAEKSALAELARIPDHDDPAFLRHAGAFIERWLGDHPDPALRTILEERDASCFRKDPAPVKLGKRRQQILRTLRKAALSCLTLPLALLLAASPTADAEPSPPAAPESTAPESTAPAPEPAPAAPAPSPAAPGADAPAPTAPKFTDPTAAYEASRFDEAIDLWLHSAPYERLSPDVLFNIGNACYRMGSPGHAALFYRRALARNPGHAEARQNLRFLERKCGAITIHRPDYQYALAKIPLAAWRGTIWAGAWMAAIALLVFPATRPGARARLVAICALVIAPLAAATGYLGWHYFPDDAEFAPLQRQAVIVSDQSVVRTDASRSSPEVIDAPVGSLAEVIRISGDWAYIAFATQTRGWIPTTAIEKVLPASPPSVPQLRKPAATDRSA